MYGGRSSLSVLKLRGSGPEIGEEAEQVKSRASQEHTQADTTQ